MNITLAIDDDLVARARKLAEARGTSLNQLVRDQLEQLTGATDPGRALAELEQIWVEGFRESPEKRRNWSREDLYDRPVLR